MIDFHRLRSDLGQSIMPAIRGRDMPSRQVLTLSTPSYRTEAMPVPVVARESWLSIGDFRFVARVPHSVGLHTIAARRTFLIPTTFSSAETFVAMSRSRNTTKYRTQGEKYGPQGS